ncbi:hypothetical protein Tco_0020354 [Tanacetum coccineum]
MRTSSNTRNQAIVHNGRVVVQNVQGRQNRVQGNNARGVFAAGNKGAYYRAGNANVGQGKPIKCYNCNGIGHDNVVDEDVDEPPVQDLALNVDNTMFMANLSSADPVYEKASPSYDSDILYEVPDQDNYQDAVCEHHDVHEMHDDVQPNYIVDSHADYTSDSNMIPYDQCVKDNAVPVVQKFDKTCKKRITPTGLTEGERGFEQTKTCYLTEVIPFFKTIKEHFEGIQKALINEIKEMKEVFDQMEVEVDQHAVDKKYDEIERKNLLIENENLIAECLPKDVFYTATNSVLTVSRFSDMHDAYTAAQKRIAELEAENTNLKNKIQNDDHDEMIKHFSKLEVEHLNLQLKYQHLKECFGNKKSETSSDAPAFESVFVIGQLQEKLQGRGNTIRELKEKIYRLQAKHSDADPILDFKALDSQNKALTIKVNALQDLNERFRVENEKVKHHYKELYDSIKLTRAKTIENTTFLLAEIENLKAQIK